MQCVILAAGEGKRLRPLTDSLPKPLIKVCGVSILDHIVQALPGEIDELVLVVGYKAERIREHCGHNFYGRKVTYVEQKNPTGGTGDALMCTRGVVRGKFLLLNGDDIYGPVAIQKIILEDCAMFGVRSDTPERFGVLLLHEDGTLKEIIEKPEHPPTNLTNINGFVLNDSVFKYQVDVSSVGEMYITDIVTAYAKENPMKVVEQDLWLPIGYPEHIAEAETVLCPK